MARRALGLAVLAVALAVPQQAFGVDFYAADGGTGDCLTAGTPCDLPTALTNAGNTPGDANVRVIGPLTYTAQVSLDDFDTRIHLIGSGSGPGGTFIDWTGSEALGICNASTVQNLRVRATSGRAVELCYGSSISDSSIENTGGDGVNVVFGTDITAPALIERSTTTAFNTAVTVGNGSAGQSLLVRDSTLTGVQGVTTPAACRCR